jgi:hypothetical protein
MDAVTLIESALATGAAGGTTVVVNRAFSDAYDGLKSLILRRVGKDDSARVVIEQHALDPTTWKEPATKLIEASGVADDPEVAEQAQQVLQLHDPEGAAEGKYVITASGPRSVAAQTITGPVFTGDVHRG